MGRVIRVAVVKVVVVGEFFSGSDVANGTDEDAAIDLVSFTIWTTRVIYECGNIVAVNHMFTVGQAKQIGARRVLVNGIGLVVCQTRPGVLDNNVLHPDWGCGVNPISVNSRLPDS
jgi:hypothetical protein